MTNSPTKIVFVSYLITHISHNITQAPYKNNPNTPHTTKVDVENMYNISQQIIHLRRKKLSLNSFANANRAYTPKKK
jgi:hypothetical protein